MLRQIGKPQFIADRRNRKKSRLANLPLDIVIHREAVAAVSREASIRRLPGRLRGEKLRHVRLRAAALFAVEFRRRLKPDKIRGLDARMRLSDGKLDALVGADGPPEDHALAGIFRRPLDEPAAVADRLRGYKNSFRIPSVDDVAEAHPLLADQVLSRDFETVKEDCVGVVIDHDIERLDVDFTPRLTEIDDEDGKPLGLVVQLIVRRRAREQQHQIRFENARDEDLLSVDDILVSLPGRDRLNARGFGACVGFCHSEGLQSQLAAGDLREITLLLLCATVAQKRSHRVHLRVASRSAPARAVDLFENDARLRDAQTAPAIFLRDRSRQPSKLRELADKGFRISPLLLHLPPVGIRKLATNLADLFPDLKLLLGQVEIHRYLLYLRVVYSAIRQMQN